MPKKRYYRCDLCHQHGPREIHEPHCPRYLATLKATVARWAAQRRAA